MNPKHPGWLGAIVYGTLIVAVAFVLLVKIPDMLISGFSDMSRSSREYLAAGWFAVALVGLLWGLRKLQARTLRK
jgi:hypothetical protein